jgi:DNA-binding GntR family transcriptional regulator
MTELASRALRSAIFSGELSPGTMLVPKTLENRLGLGKMAIREAIRELIGSGLVKALPNKGALVAQPPSLEEIKEIYVLRKHLEKKIAIRAVSRISTEEIDRLDALHRKMLNGPDGSGNYFLINRKFHLTLYEASGWEFMCRLINQMLDQILVFRSQFQYTAGDNQPFNRQHQHILDAIRRDQAKQLGRLVEAKLQSGLEDILKIAQDMRLQKSGA